MSTFISLEGPEGSGKSTQAQGLAAHLRGRGYDVLLTREPGGTEIGDQIRRVLFRAENLAMLPETEFLLFSASRAQLVREVIAPHLDSGGMVVCDRFFHSSLAYQGYGHDLDLEALSAVTSFATGDLRPDLVLLLDVPVERGLQRRRQEGGWNRLDAYELGFHRRVRQGYLTMAERESDRWVLIDATHAPDQVERQIRDQVEARLAKAAQ